jgi:hypothetical protein
MNLFINSRNGNNSTGTSKARSSMIFSLSELNSTQKIRK